MNSHNTNIITGISDLVAEIHGLQSQLSITTNEKNDLIETVKNLSDEIRQLKSELTILQPFPESKVNHHQEQDTGYLEDSVAQDQDEAALENGNEAEEEELPLNHGNIFNETTCYKMPEEDDNDPVHDEANEKEVIDCDEEELSLETIRSKKEKMIVDSSSDKTLQYQPYGNKEDTLDFSKKENMKIHMNNAHFKLERPTVCPVDKGESEHTDHSLERQVYFSEDTNSYRGNKLHQEGVNQEMSKNFKCELCPFITTTRRNLNAHINRVHNRRQVCTECDKSYADKHNLEAHRETAHFGNKKFKCEQCPFASGYETSLKTHINVVHEKIKRFFCGKCNYTATIKANLTYHIESVHKLEKKFKCEKCPYTSATKGNLKNHTESVHGMGEKKFKCDLCPYRSHLKVYLKVHVTNVHLHLRKMRRGRKKEPNNKV